MLCCRTGHCEHADGSHSWSPLRRDCAVLSGRARAGPLAHRRKTSHTLKLIEKLGTDDRRHAVRQRRAGLDAHLSDSPMACTHLPLPTDCLLRAWHSPGSDPPGRVIHAAQEAQAPALPRGLRESAPGARRSATLRTPPLTPFRTCTHPRAPHAAILPTNTGRRTDRRMHDPQTPRHRPQPPAADRPAEGCPC